MFFDESGFPSDTLYWVILLVDSVIMVVRRWCHSVKAKRNSTAIILGHCYDPFFFLFYVSNKLHTSAIIRLSRWRWGGSSARFTLFRYIQCQINWRLKATGGYRNVTAKRLSPSFDLPVNTCFEIVANNSKPSRNWRNDLDNFAPPSVN